MVYAFVHGSPDRLEAGGAAKQKVLGCGTTQHFCVIDALTAVQCLDDNTVTVCDNLNQLRDGFGELPPQAVRRGGLEWCGGSYGLRSKKRSVIDPKQIRIKSGRVRGTRLGASPVEVVRLEVFRLVSRRTDIPVTRFWLTQCF